MTREEIEKVEAGICPRCASTDRGIQEIADVESHCINGLHSEAYAYMCDCGFSCAKIKKWKDDVPEWVEWV